MARILISAGHTMMDPGAIYQDLKEADLTRKIAPVVIDHLQKASLEVQGVPLDLPLFQRIDWINNTGYTADQGDVLVEIHVNDADGSKRGFESWFEGNGDNSSEKLAAVIMDTLKKDTKYDSQGAHSEYDHNLGSLTFLNRTNPAAVILEVFYIDNVEDIKLLKDEAQITNVGKSIANGIARYFAKDLGGKDLVQKPDFAQIIKDNVITSVKPQAVEPIEAASEEDDDELDAIFADAFWGGAKAPSNAAPTAPSLPKPVNLPTFTPPPPANPFNSSPFAGNGQTKPNNPAFSAAPANNMMMDREQRKQMIEDYYRKILGRPAEQNEVNHFLNKGVTKEQLLEKMVESQEHADIVTAKKELDKTKKDLENLEQKMQRLEATMTDQREMLSSLNRLVAFKNKTISELQALIEERKGVPGEVFLSKQNMQARNQVKQPTNLKLKQSLKESVFGALVKKKK